jgi:hypothetical protein
MQDNEIVNSFIKDYEDAIAKKKEEAKMIAEEKSMSAEKPVDDPT